MLKKKRSNVSSDRRSEKAISIDNHFGVYTWIDPSLRDVKTQKHFEILTKIFKDGKIVCMPEKNVRIALKRRGFIDGQIDKIMREAERDYVFYLHSEARITTCHWIPFKDRQGYAKFVRNFKEWMDKWGEKDEIWEESLV